MVSESTTTQMKRGTKETHSTEKERVLEYIITAMEAVLRANSETTRGMVPGSRTTPMAIDTRESVAARQEGCYPLQSERNEVIGGALRWRAEV